MRILVTGSNGFLGKNLIAELRNRAYDDIMEFTRASDPDSLDEYCKKADFVYHLAGVNRPQEQFEFMEGNFGLTSLLLETLRRNQNFCPVMMASSIQASLDNPYGQSKKAGEEILQAYSIKTGAKSLVYRFPNIFGKWCRPDYNSVVATFCHHIARDLPIQINDENAELKLVYIDDVVEELINALKGRPHINGTYCSVPVVYSKRLGEIVELVRSFKENRSSLRIPDLGDPFIKNLYSTYLSYLPEDQFGYELKMNRDQRGSFTEFIKTPDRGQVSVNIIKPGIVKGNHWHHTKNEKFLVVSGRGVIRFRNLNAVDVKEYPVSGARLQVLDIPPGYVHQIENLGAEDLVTIIWVNEVFNPEYPDTFSQEV